MMRRWDGHRFVTEGERRRQGLTRADGKLRAVLRAAVVLLTDMDRQRVHLPACAAARLRLRHTVEEALEAVGREPVD
jgi:hypothetical protein